MTSSRVMVILTTLPVGRRKVSRTALCALLADGALGPVVGTYDAEGGGVTIDEAAWGGEWVGELLLRQGGNANAVMDDGRLPALVH